METLLLVGLGNVGTAYQKTRHNAGFLFVEALKEAMQFENLKEESKLNSSLSINKNLESSSFLNVDRVMLAEPSTMMNNSGLAVTSIIKFYDIPLENVVVAYDDLDIKFGKFKIQKGKGPKAHNGIISIENSLGTNDFFRIRIGVENRTEEIRKNFTGRDYVLSKFSNEELTTLNEEVFPEIISELKGIYS